MPLSLLSLRRSSRWSAHEPRRFMPARPLRKNTTKTAVRGLPVPPRPRVPSLKRINNKTSSRALQRYNSATRTYYTPKHSARAHTKSKRGVAGSGTFPDLPSTVSHPGQPLHPSQGSPWRQRAVSRRPLTSAPVSPPHPLGNVWGSCFREAGYTGRGEGGVYIDAGASTRDRELIHRRSQ